MSIPEASRPLSFETRLAIIEARLDTGNGAFAEQREKLAKVEGRFEDRYEALRAEFTPKPVPWWHKVGVVAICLGLITYLATLTAKPSKADLDVVRNVAEGTAELRRQETEAIKLRMERLTTEMGGFRDSQGVIQRQLEQLLAKPERRRRRGGP